MLSLAKMDGKDGDFYRDDGDAGGFHSDATRHDAGGHDVDVGGDDGDVD